MKFKDLEVPVESWQVLSVAHSSGRREAGAELEEMSQVHTMQASARTRSWVFSSRILLQPTSLPKSVSQGPVEDSMLVDVLMTKSASSSSP